MSINLSRITSALLGMPLVIIILVFGNVYVVDFAFAIIAAIALHEFLKCFEGKAKPIIWIGYFASIFIAFMHILPSGSMMDYVGSFFFLMIVLLFIEVFRSQMQVNIVDISITFFGICYIVFFLMFVPLVRGFENGQYLIWYIFTASWGTDVFAYIVGKLIGKHKFSKISPKKSIEGCIGGVIGAVLLTLAFTYGFNEYAGLNISYEKMLIFSIILSIIGQMGDFAASSVKRYVGIKDFSNLIPGHGGMLDRFDSVIFIAPAAYFLLMFI